MLSYLLSPDDILWVKKVIVAVSISNFKFGCSEICNMLKIMTLAVFTLKTDYATETGYLLDNSRQTDNTS